MENRRRNHPSRTTLLALCLVVAFFADTNLQTTSAAVGKANLILMERGLQVQGIVTSGDVFNLDTYIRANYTSINWLWDSNTSLMGTAPGFPWARWVRNEGEVPPLGTEGPYMSQLVSLQLGDEWPLNEVSWRDRAVNWFNAIRANFPNTILYMNSYGGQVSDGPLDDFIRRAQPDMLCFDSYPWKSDYVSRNPYSGPPTTWYSDLRRYREHARGNNIPFATYMQTFHAVQDYDQTVYRDPSPSELRLNHSAALAFNAKSLIDFTYNTGASSLFTNPGGDTYPTPLYAEKTDAALRARNFGRALTRLQPIADATNQYTTSMMFVRGKNPSGTPNPIPISFIADPSAPNTYTDWEFTRNDPYLTGWTVTNTGTKNSGQPGDVIISWFKVLDESMDGRKHAGQIYFMVVNGLSDPSGIAADCRQEIRLNFIASAVPAVDIVDPVSGQVQTQALPLAPTTNTRRQLILNLNGGDAALFKFANGAPFAGITPIAPEVIVSMAPDTATIRLEGAVGSRYRLEASPSLVPSLANWTPLTTLVLPSSPYVFEDPVAADLPARFYRAVSLP